MNIFRGGAFFIAFIIIVIVGVSAFIWVGSRDSSGVSLENEHDRITDVQQLGGGLAHLQSELERLDLSLALWQASQGQQGQQSALESNREGIEIIDRIMPIAKRSPFGAQAYLRGLRAALLSYFETIKKLASARDQAAAEQVRASVQGWLKSIDVQRSQADHLEQALISQHEKHEDTLWYGLLIVAGGALFAVALLFVLWQRQWRNARSVSQSRDVYHQVFQGSYAVELLIDVETGKILDANRAAVDFYGWDLKTLCSMNIQAINCLTKEETRQEMEKAKMEKRNHFFFVHRLANGETRDVEVHSTPFVNNGRTVLSSIVHDISRQREAERALLASQQRYSDIIDASAQGFWFVEPKSGIIIDVNSALCSLLGYSREEILGRSFISFACEDDQPALHERFSRAIHSLHRVYDVRLKTAQGQIRHTRFHATSLLDASGALSGSYAFIDDITEQRNSRARLEESQKRLEAVIEAGGIGIWEYAPQTGKMWLSPEWKAQLGYRDQDFASSIEAWESVIFPEDRQVLMQRLDALTETAEGGQLSLMLRYRHRAGHTVHARCSVRTLYGLNGEVERFLGAHLDLTPQLEIQETLARTNARNALVLDSATDGLLAVDEEGRVILINAACQRIFGQPAQAIIGRDADDFLHLADAEGQALRTRAASDDGHGEPEPLISSVLRTGKALLSLEAYICQSNQASIAVEFGVAPLLWQGKVTGAVVSLHDVSEQKDYRAELERSNNELEQFAYMASHDLQEPLRTITSYLTLLRRRYAEAVDDDGKVFINTAVDGAHRMSTMIRDLLDYSRVGRKGGDLLPVSATAAAAIALENLQIAVEEVQAQVSIQPDMPQVMADHGQLVSLFQNLIGNAIKYRDAERPIIVKVQASITAGRLCQIHISDNGIGIDPAYYERIFQPFQRLHTRSDFEGNGIGLAICRKIVRRHGGDLTVQSQPGVGSTFIFTLALA